MQKTFSLTLIFIIAIAISIIAVQQFTVDNSQNTDRKNQHIPDTFIVKAHYFSTNEDGIYEFKMFSPKVLHYQFQDSTFILNPNILVNKNSRQWIINSNIGRTINHGETIFLEDNVRIKQLSSVNNPSTLLTTNTLTVFPKKNLATTHEPVTIEQPGLKINAVGLRANLNTGNIELLSKTRGKYDPKVSR